MPPHQVLCNPRRPHQKQLHPRLRRCPFSQQVHPQVFAALDARAMVLAAPTQLGNPPQCLHDLPLQQMPWGPSAVHPEHAQRVASVLLEAAPPLWSLILALEPKPSQTLFLALRILS